MGLEEGGPEGMVAKSHFGPYDTGKSVPVGVWTRAAAILKVLVKGFPTRPRPK